MAVWLMWGWNVRGIEGLLPCNVFLQCRCVLAFAGFAVASDSETCGRDSQQVPLRIRQAIGLKFSSLLGCTDGRTTDLNCCPMRHLIPGLIV